MEQNNIDMTLSQLYNERLRINAIIAMKAEQMLQEAKADEAKSRLMLSQLADVNVSTIFEAQSHITGPVEPVYISASDIDKAIAEGTEEETMEDELFEEETSDEEIFDDAEEEIIEEDDELVDVEEDTYDDEETFAKTGNKRPIDGEWRQLQMPFHMIGKDAPELLKKQIEELDKESKKVLLPAHIFFSGEPINEITHMGNLKYKKEWSSPSETLIIHPNGISPCLTTVTHPMIFIDDTPKSDRVYSPEELDIYRLDEQPIPPAHMTQLQTNDDHSGPCAWIYHEKSLSLRCSSTS